MNRIKTRIALLLAATALSSIAMAAPAAAGGCYPYPEVYCETMDWYDRCVVGPIKYGWEPCNGG